MRRTWLIICLFLSLSLPVMAEEIQSVLVADPFLELHTGPGEGYPVTQIIERGEEVGIVKQRTDWFLVRGPRGNEGWAYRDQLEQTLQLTGEPVVFPKADISGYRDHTWEAGIMAGDFDGATVYNVFGSWSFSKHLAAELHLAQLLGNTSDGWYATVNVTHTFVPKWRVSPFFSLGTGIIEVNPKSALAQTTDRSDEVAVVGVGLKAFAARRFIVRLQYNGYVVLSDRDDNEDIDEWKAGFAVFF
jgi:uncharacterized protein YgiM (DUF1202 family)